jgi:predicted lipid-binding transport protein (Tim44 family)
MTRVLLVLALLFGGAIAEARPGGGHTSSGGGRSSSSSHSSSYGGGGYRGGSSYSGGSYGGGAFGGEAILVLFVIVGVLWVITAMAKQGQGPAWTSDIPAPEPAPRADLAAIRAHDPAFSVALFEDFAFELYAAAQRRRGGQLQTLQPYLSPAAASQLDGRGPPPQQVVVGALRIAQAGVRPTGARVLVHIEATLLGAGRPVAAVERWMFTRSLEAKTKPPERTRSWPCPNCGAPWQPSPTRTCANCGQPVQVGTFDWCVEQAWVESETTAVASLTGTVEEYGTDLPTVRAPDVDAQLAQLAHDDPEVTFEKLYPRIELIYDQLNTAWNARDLTPVRGLVTGALRDYLDYWIRAYAAQGLRNANLQAKLDGAEPAKVVRDPYYDAITVRILAHGNEVTYDAKDRVVGGSPDRARRYSEYWTFLRSSARRGKITTTPTCPNCGAPLQISDAGDCEHCGVAVENGSFDWILSKIEQDDNYAG